MVLLLTKATQVLGCVQSRGFKVSHRNQACLSVERSEGALRALFEAVPPQSRQGSSMLEIRVLVCVWLTFTHPIMWYQGAGVPARLRGP